MVKLTSLAVFPMPVLGVEYPVFWDEPKKKDLGYLDVRDMNRPSEVLQPKTDEDQVWLHRYFQSSNRTPLIFISIGVVQLVQINRMWSHMTHQSS